MSCMESKFALRAEIKELEGASYHDAYNYFINKLGEPSEVEDWEDKIEFFTYDKNEHDIVPILDYSTKRWGIDYLLQYSYDGEMIKGLRSFSINDLLSKMKILEEKFNVSTDEISIVNYEWYNGSDEPVHIK